jgi:hypothetical protein
MAPQKQSNDDGLRGERPPLRQGHAWLGETPLPAKIAQWWRGAPGIWEGASSTASSRFP